MAGTFPLPGDALPNKLDNGSDVPDGGGAFFGLTGAGGWTGLDIGPPSIESICSPASSLC